MIIRKPLKITSFRLERRKADVYNEKGEIVFEKDDQGNVKKTKNDKPIKTKGDLITENVPILVDFKYDGKRAIQPIGYRIDDDKWNEKEQIVKRNNFNKNGVSAAIINKRINNITELLPKIYNDAVDLDIEIDIKYLWKRLTELLIIAENLTYTPPQQNKRKTFIDYIQEFMTPRAGRKIGAKTL